MIDARRHDRMSNPSYLYPFSSFAPLRLCVSFSSSFRLGVSIFARVSLRSTRNGRAGRRRYALARPGTWVRKPL